MTGPALSRREIGGLALATLAALGTGEYLRRNQPVGRDVSDTVDVPALLHAPGFPFEGPPDAAVTMLVFSDYACGVCRQVEPWWRAAAREADKAGFPVRVIHRDWPILGPASLCAARMALAADRQGLYDEVHQNLMRSGRHDAAAVREALVAAGGNWDRLERDLVAQATAIDRLLARTAQDARQLGFRGTPGFLIGPLRIEGGASQSQFADAIARVWRTA